MNTYIKLFTDELKNNGLSLYDKAVFGSLLTKYEYHNKEAFYTYEAYIADELEISESTVKRSIKKLNEVGLITINKRFHKQLKQTVNYYSIPTIDEDKPEVVEPTNSIEQLATIIDSVANDEVPYEDGLQAIKSQLNKVKEEQVNQYKKQEKQDVLEDIIAEQYGKSIEDYFGQFNNMYELGFSRMEKLADLSKDCDTRLTPDDVLTIFKTITNQKPMVNIMI